jgi:hypothetical protein
MGQCAWFVRGGTRVLLFPIVVVWGLLELVIGITGPRRWPAL